MVIYKSLFDWNIYTRLMVGIRVLVLYFEVFNDSLSLFLLDVVVIFLMVLVASSIELLLLRFILVWIAIVRLYRSVRF